MTEIELLQQLVDNTKSSSAGYIPLVAASGAVVGALISSGVGYLTARLTVANHRDVEEKRARDEEKKNKLMFDLEMEKIRLEREKVKTDVMYKQKLIWMSELRDGFARLISELESCFNLILFGDANGEHEKMAVAAKARKEISRLESMVNSYLMESDLKDKGNLSVSISELVSSYYALYVSTIKHGSIDEDGYKELIEKQVSLKTSMGISSYANVRAIFDKL